MAEHDATERQQRTEVARAAAAKTFARRRVARATAELEQQGYVVIAPTDAGEAREFDGDGILPRSVPGTEYRCPGCGRGAWYVKAADRLYHRDGTDNTACFRAMHRGTTMHPLPEIRA